MVTSFWLSRLIETAYSDFCGVFTIIGDFAVILAGAFAFVVVFTAVVLTEDVFFVLAVTLGAAAFTGVLAVALSGLCWRRGCFFVLAEIFTGVVAFFVIVVF